MYHQFHNRLLTAVKQCIPPGNSLAPTLMELLSLGKEAIYRRLRNEVPFTVEEVMKISQKFGILLDRLSCADSDVDKVNWAAFDMDMLYAPHNYMEKHCEKLETFLPVFRDMQYSKKAMLRNASCFMPYTFILHFENLARFRHYKWIYLAQAVNPNFLFADMVIPVYVLELEKKIVAEIQQIPRTLMILDRNIFTSLLNDIRYFFHRQLIFEDELHKLKDELLDLVIFMEGLTATGTYPTGTEINIFLSEIDLGSTYTHIEYDQQESCMNWSYFVDIIQFFNPKMCQKQKEWIELLKRYSVHISQTGEMYRVDFFNKQRKLIEELTNPV